MTDPEALLAGYTRARSGKAEYAGALRKRPGGDPVWACPHKHLTPGQATACAVTELDHRTQGAREVLVLLRCGGCARWYGETAGTACPRCEVPMARLKLLVLEQGPAIPAPKGIL